MHDRFVFEPLAVSIAAAAFTDACRKVPEAPDDVRALLARRILGTASLGVRDPQQMADDALNYLRS